MCSTRTDPGRVLAAVLAFVASLLLAACGGETSDPDAPPTSAERVELVGTVTPGYGEVAAGGGTEPAAQGHIGVSVRGAAGTPRSSDTVSAGASQHRTGLSQLTAPYLLSHSVADGSGTVLFSVATGPGRANLTPLTTLLVAQLLGADPQTAFNSYGPGASGSADRITDANIAAAQAAVTGLLENTLGVTVKSGGASFVTADFQAETGDAMFDTLVALDAKLAADGSSLQALSQSVAAEARLCLTEKLDITVSGRSSDFCPQTKSGQPESADAGVLAYELITSKGERLALRVRGDALLSVAYRSAAGKTYDCSGSGCSRIALGKPADDLSRHIDFDAARLDGATLRGGLTLPVPGVVIPVLPCDDNKLVLVLPDRSVVAECADAADPLGIGAVLGGSAGLPRVGFQLGSTATVYAEGGVVTGITDLKPYTDPATGRQVFFQCLRAACAGAVFGPPTINSDLGIDLTIRSFTMTDVQLRAVNADGTPASLTATARLQGSFTTIEYIDPAYADPPPNDCAGTTDHFFAQPNYRPETIDLCPVPDYNQAVLRVDGTLQLSFLGYAPIGVAPTFSMTLAGDDSVQTVYLLAGEGEFRCSGDCAGVAVGAPNAAGERVITFTDALLREVGPAGLPGEHTLTLNGSYVAPKAVQATS